MATTDDAYPVCRSSLLTCVRCHDVFPCACLSTLKSPTLVGDSHRLLRLFFWSALFCVWFCTFLSLLSTGEWVLLVVNEMCGDAGCDADQGGEERRCEAVDVWLAWWFSSFFYYFVDEGYGAAEGC